MQITILDEEGKEVASRTGAKGSIIIEKVRRWEPNDAYLYTARIEYEEDQYEESFGVRSVEVKGNQFLINGKPFYFKGVGKHEDSAIHGRGMDEVLNVKDILLKWMGANSFPDFTLSLCGRDAGALRQGRHRCN